MKLRMLRISRYVSVLVVCSAWAATVSAQTPIKLTLAHTASKGTPKAEALTRFADTVKDKSGGRIVIEINPGGGNQENRDILLDMRTGKLDISSYPQNRLASVLPEVDALTLPYAFLTAQKAWDILDGAIGQELEAKIESRGMIALGWMNNGARHFTSSKQPIRGPEDLRGLRIRTTGDKATIDMMAVLGAQVVPISYNYLSDAVKTGYVDAQENSLNVISLRKVHEEQKFITITYHNYTFSPLLISRGAWDKLTSSDKKTIRDAAREATVLQRKLFEDDENRILDEYRKMDSVTLTTPDPTRFHAAVQKVWDAWELKAIGPFVKKLRAASRQ